MTLHPGDILYLPQYTYHRVTAVAGEVSLSYNSWATARETDRVKQLVATAADATLLPFGAGWGVQAKALVLERMLEAKD